jgi:UDP-N-acetylmuramyl tripeptide synthase
VEYDSRRVRAGTVFVAMKGETSDGNRFIDQAIVAGAVAIGLLWKMAVLRNTALSAPRVNAPAAAKPKSSRSRYKR